MKRKMFGHAQRKTSHQRVPGQPYNDMDYEYGKENEESYKYAKNKDFPHKEKGIHQEKNKDAPSGYEGKEHVSYKNPGYSSHHIRFPQDEPHMKSHVSQDEEHEMEDDYHQRIPDQTHYSLEHKLKRARMKMDAPDQEDPDMLRGNMVHNVSAEGEKDTTGEEEMGPNDMQQEGMSKDHRKKMIVAITKRKMKKK